MTDFRIQCLYYFDDPPQQPENIRANCRSHMGQYLNYFLVDIRNEHGHRLRLHACNSGRYHPFLPKYTWSTSTRRQHVSKSTFKVARRRIHSSPNCWGKAQHQQLNFPATNFHWHKSATIFQSRNIWDFQGGNWWQRQQARCRIHQAHSFGHRLSATHRKRQAATFTANIG